MKLYEFPYAPNPRRVRIFLAEKGIDVPRVHVNLMEKEHLSAAYTKINSLQKVPALELDDGTIITESIAICRYLEELHPTPALFGSTAVERAQVEMWNRRMELQIFNTISTCVFHSDPFFKDSIRQVPAMAEAAKLDNPEKWAWLDGELADGRPFVAGKAFSVADITGMVACGAADAFKIPIPDLPHVRRWIDRLRERPSFNA
ncbi:glutathione S-transferase family protein [Pendulispora brunnea]|uniref:Glutathione S-transferase family protein n=1 Tax=Pendulispora brunnea TaxID=2905690 RepID=A0ABZ2KAW9_9BACT